MNNNKHSFILVAFLVAFLPCVSSAEETTIDRTGRIILEAHTDTPAPPDFFTASAKANVRITTTRVEQTIDLNIRIIQGNAKTLSLGLNGNSRVTEVTGDDIKSWSVRREEKQRFLDIHCVASKTDEEERKLNATIKIQSTKLTLPSNIDLTHLSRGEAVGFDSTIKIQYASQVTGTVTAIDGFAPLGDRERADAFQTATGGKITLSLARDGAAPGPIELTDTTLVGEMHDNGQSMQFRLSGSAHVTEPNAEVDVLSGNAAIIAVPKNEAYRLRLTNRDGRAVYQLVFPRSGTFPVSLDFVARLAAPNANWRGTDFTVASGAVVPITLKGLDENLEFHRDQNSVVPLRSDANWIGFLPATGRARLQWKVARKSGEGKLFFATTARIDAEVGSGLLRQTHQIDYQVLQGELPTIQMQLDGPGEILDVRGGNVVAWKVTGNGNQRQLEATLSQPMSGSSQITVRTQTPLGAFPVQVEGLRITPSGAIRHSGHLRLRNSGAVRLEMTGLVGLTQLAPNQFPRSSSSKASSKSASQAASKAANAASTDAANLTNADQTFVYRFPAADHAFTVVADRIQPEVNVSQVLQYELTETDRVIRADVELDIRQATIREWDLGIPSDYSVVSVTGANVADYVTATQAADGQRNLKVIFGRDVIGRQLITLHMEKNETAAAGDWTLPRIAYPEAKTVRGHVGIGGAAGFRIAVKESNLLVEKPLSYFPKPNAKLQQAFRIREPGWSATMTVERLERSVQSDVFHLYSLSQETIYGSALINYFVTGAPVSEWRVTVPESLGNVMIDGQDVRTWRRDGDELIVSLHQGVMGTYTLLVTYEEKPDVSQSSFQVGQVQPLEVNSERGYLQVVSPMQVEASTITASEDLLKLEPLELPAEFRLLTTAPPLGTWQYTERPFDLNLKVNWFEPGTTVPQVVEFSEANSRVSQDGELVTDILYYVKSRGQRTLRIQLPAEPVRLWATTVNGQSVTARQTEDATLIPLPGGVDPNVPVEVRLRLGKPTVSKSQPRLTLPIVQAPVLKTQWSISGDPQRVLIPGRGTVKPSQPVLRPSGFDWVARFGLAPFIAIGILTIAGAWASRFPEWRPLGVVGLLAAMIVACFTLAVAWDKIGTSAPLTLSLPILAAGETVELRVHNTPLWQANFSSLGILTVLLGLAVTVWSYLGKAIENVPMIFVRAAGLFLIAFGVLFHRDGAPSFFAVLAAMIGIFALLPAVRALIQQINEDAKARAERKAAEAEKTDGNVDDEPGGAGAGAVVTTILLVALLFPGLTDRTFAQEDDPFGNATQQANSAAFQTKVRSVAVEQLLGTDGFSAADSLTQQWQITQGDARLNAVASATFTGEPGDRFLLLRSPAVLTRFEGTGLRLTKQEVPGCGLAYVVSIPNVATDQESDDVSDEDATEAAQPEQFEAEFEYQLEALNLAHIPVLTGLATVSELDVTLDESGWQLKSNNAVRIESIDSENASDDASTRAKVLLGLGNASLTLQPKARDVATEETKFFVEGSNLYLPGPGVINGRHQLHVRTSQGEVSQLTVQIPMGLTVSNVDGPIGSWQFDADSGRLELQLEPAQSQAFHVMIETQRGLDPLPVDTTLGPVTVDNANGQVGLLAVAFGPDAQPETATPTTMSAVNLGDFDAKLLPSNVALHRVYRYGADGGELALRVAPVDPEVRILSKQVLSLGDERVLLGINFGADITRAGLFQLSFPLPDGFEIESLTGNALDHWSEIQQDGDRKIVMHLNGKTIGRHNFTLTITGASPTNDENWTIPRFQISEANRQTGELVIRPTTGIRLRTLERQNVSETDPRSAGGNATGALAFRLLQRDWDLQLGIEKLDPWVTGNVLHEVTLREGQTRTALLCSFQVQNASIRTMQVKMPPTSDDEIKTLRATGNVVSDFVRTAPNSDVWEVQFKRRVIGKVDFRIEYERRGDREDDSESLSPASFPQARQLSYYFGVRAGGRFEISSDTLDQGWQQVAWNTVPQTLREAADRNSPTLALRAINPRKTLTIKATRHSVANALKLRVTNGTLTTVLSSNGDQLTAVDVTMEVIQRSSLSVGLPADGELLSIFVNGESVNSIRKGGTQDSAENAWQFYILPGMDDRTAKVRFVYSLRGRRVTRLKLVSPQLNVPLENIEWNVIAPKGFELTDNDGNLELVKQRNKRDYDRRSYLSKISNERQQQQQQANQLLEQANQLLMAGEQTKARWALNSVANQYALDAASNEDARVQLENLQTQQAIVGLNTRRQRLYMSNSGVDTGVIDNKQLRDAAAANPILQLDQLNFRPQQLSQLLRGNTTEDNTVLQRIAGRLVQHQRNTDPAPQAILISLPEEGSVYTFRRSVQVAEEVPLELDLRFGKQDRAPIGSITVLLLGLAGLVVSCVTLGAVRKTAEASV